MRHSKARLAVIAVLVASMSVPVLARGRSGGSHAGRGGHSFSGTHAGVGHHRPHRFFSPRVGVFVGAPLLYAPFLYPPPGSYYPLPPPVYMQMPSQEHWYFCPGANAYYPYVEECPGGWQQVAPQPQG